MQLGTTYNEVEISYNEDDSKFEFQLRGRLRSAATLKEAKEAIDKTPKEAKKPFERFTCWLIDANMASSLFGNTKPEVVEVTSFAGMEKDYASSREPEEPRFWGLTKSVETTR